jgi:uncharacterized membrane protein SpoIIM required for sporulation
LDRFIAEREPLWTELESLVGRAGAHPERLGPEGVKRLGALYRSATADLAYARRRFEGDPVVARLEDVVGRARHLVYDAATRRRSLLRFFTDDYWRVVAERPVALALAAALLLAPALLSGLWAFEDPGAAAGLVPAQLRSVTEPRPHNADLGLSADEKAVMASEIFTNNIRVTFLAFAGGIAIGLVTAAVVLFNGILLGVVGGLAIGAGNGRPFLQLVTAHGVLELSCIVVAAAAGLRMGWALIDPGRKRRTESLADEARRAVEIVLGTAPWLVLAGLVEGFVTPSGLELPVVLVIGIGLGTIYWSLVVWRGRGERSAAVTPDAWHIIKGALGASP